MLIEIHTEVSGIHSKIIKLRGGEWEGGIDETRVAICL